jgi:hypothetical protein
MGGATYGIRLTNDGSKACLADGFAHILVDGNGFPPHWQVSYSTESGGFGPIGALPHSIAPGRRVTVLVEVGSRGPEGCVTPRWQLVLPGGTTAVPVKPPPVRPPLSPPNYVPQACPNTGSVVSPIYRSHPKSWTDPLK